MSLRRVFLVRHWFHCQRCWKWWWYLVWRDWFWPSYHDRSTHYDRRCLVWCVGELRGLRTEGQLWRGAQVNVLDSNALDSTSDVSCVSADMCDKCVTNLYVETRSTPSDQLHTARITPSRDTAPNKSSVDANTPSALSDQDDPASALTGQDDQPSAQGGPVKVNWSSSTINTGQGEPASVHTPITQHTTHDVNRVHNLTSTPFSPNLSRVLEMGPKFALSRP